MSHSKLIDPTTLRPAAGDPAKAWAYYWPVRANAIMENCDSRKPTWKQDAARSKARREACRERARLWETKAITHAGA